MQIAYGKWRDYYPDLQESEGQHKTGVLLRDRLLRRCGVDPERATFVKNEYGKPSLAEGNVSFSISHSGDFVVCVADKVPLGVDIERFSGRDPARCAAIVRRFFGESEQAWFFANGGDERAFLILWTRKESATKASGNGFSGFATTDVTPGNTAYPPDGDAFSTEITSDYVCTVCIPKTR